MKRSPAASKPSARRRHAISEDVQFAISGGPGSSHGNIGRLPAAKKLVNHDLRSLKMLVTATQAANDA